MNMIFRSESFREVVLTEGQLVMLTKQSRIWIEADDHPFALEAATTRDPASLDPDEFSSLLSGDEIKGIRLMR